MKMTKKKVLVSALAVCLLAILSFGTLAWFNATDEVTNEFYFADSDDDGQTDFSVDVTESGDPEDDGLVFEEILPGDVLEKDPTIKNTSSSDRYSQYIRVTLKLKDPEGAWKNAFDGKRIGNGKYLTLLKEMFQTVDQMNLWDLAGGEGIGYGYDEEAKEFYWVFYYKNVLGKDEEVKLFEQVTIPTGLTVEDASAMKSAFEVTVKAEAVQAENLGLEAWQGAKAAFEVVGEGLN